MVSCSLLPTLLFLWYSLFFFFNDTATTEIYTFSLHDALPICWATPHERDDTTVPGRARVRSHRLNNYDWPAGSDLSHSQPVRSHRHRAGCIVVRFDEINFPGLRLLRGCYVGNMAGRYPAAADLPASGADSGELGGFGDGVPVVGAGLGAGEEVLWEILLRFGGGELVGPGDAGGGAGARAGGPGFGVVGGGFVGGAAPVVPADRIHFGGEFRVDENDAGVGAPGAAEADLAGTRRRGGRGCCGLVSPQAELGWGTRFS